jgi:thioredoxin-related protein
LTVDRLIIALVVVAVAAGVAELLRRRRVADPPTQAHRELPSQLDRADFDGVGWLVAVFTSDTCSSCDDVKRKAEVLSSPNVAVQSVSFQARRDLHQRYGIDAVPSLLIADAEGVVHASFIGPVTATDLWAVMAECREPGSVDRGTCEH